MCGDRRKGFSSVFYLPAPPWKRHGACQGNACRWLVAPSAAGCTPSQAPHTRVRPHAISRSSNASLSSALASRASLASSPSAPPLPLLPPLLLVSNNSGPDPRRCCGGLKLLRDWPLREARRLWADPGLLGCNGSRADSPLSVDWSGVAAGLQPGLRGETPWRLNGSPPGCTEPRRADVAAALGLCRGAERLEDARVGVSP